MNALFMKVIQMAILELVNYVQQVSMEIKLSKLALTVTKHA